MRILWSDSSPSRDVKITILLFLLLLAVNLAGIWSILTSRENARAAAFSDFELRTRTQAHSLEALLASLRGDFLFLTQSAPLVNFAAADSSEDPIVRRWGRLDVEGSVLLFLAAHPEVERITIRIPSGGISLVAGRRDGAPLLLPPEEGSIEEPSGGGFLPTRWPLGSSGDEPASLEALVSLEALLARVAGDANSALVATSSAAPVGGQPDGDFFEVAVPVVENSWEPPIHWTLIRREQQNRLMETTALLSSRYRTILMLNLAIMSMTLVIGLVAFQQVRRRARLEGEKQQQERVRQLELQVLHSDRLASLGRVVAGVAHEINNPLEGIENYLSLLEEDLRESRTQDAPGMLRNVREGVERIATIVRRVLNFSDPGRSRPEKVDLSAIVKETLHFAHSHPSRGSCETVLSSPDTPLWVQGDAAMLGQLLLNLLINAFEAQQGKGSVSVSCDRDGRKAIVTVADEGPGIVEAELYRIFEPFYSTRGSTGLGLSVCHGIAAQHRGELTASNRPSGGALFKVEIPLDPPSQEPQEK